MICEVDSGQWTVDSGQWRVGCPRRKAADKAMPIKCGRERPRTEQSTAHCTLYTYGFSSVRTVIIFSAEVAASVQFSYVYLKSFICVVMVSASSLSGIPSVRLCFTNA